MCTTLMKIGMHMIHIQRDSSKVVYIRAVVFKQTVQHFDWQISRHTIFSRANTIVCV